MHSTSLEEYALRWSNVRQTTQHQKSSRAAKGSKKVILETGLRQEKVCAADRQDGKGSGGGLDPRSGGSRETDGRLAGRCRHRRPSGSGGLRRASGWLGSEDGQRPQERIRDGRRVRTRHPSPTEFTCPARQPQSCRSLPGKSTVVSAKRLLV